MDTPTARELAAVRSRRAKVAAQAAAAAKRRLLLTVLLLLAVGAVVTAAGFKLLPWAWVALPSTLLVAVLGLGARAAAVGRKADQQLLDRIARLKREARTGNHSLTPRPTLTAPKPARGTRTVSKAPSGKGIAAAHRRSHSEQTGALAPAHTPQPAATKGADEGAAKAPVKASKTPETKSAPTAPAAAAPRRAQVAQVVDEDALGQVIHVNATARASANQQRAAQRDPLRGIVSETAKGDPFAKPWTPMPLPQPTYAMKPMLQRRDVDTQALIAQQRQEVSAAVPFRPSQPATPQGVPLTSAQVAGTGAISLDVDDVLNRRRLG